MARTAKEDTENTASAPVEQATVVLFNRLTQDVFVGEGNDAFCIPPRGQVQVTSDKVPDELPEGITKSTI